MTVDVDELTELDRVALGGTASVWRCLHVGRRRLYKKFDENYRRGLNGTALEELVRFPQSLPEDDRARLLELCAWPLAVVTKGGDIAGILMEPADRDFETSRRDRMEPRHLTALAVPQQVAAAQGREYFQMPHKIGRLGQLLIDLRFLHRLQVVIGDLQPKNVLTTGPAVPGAAGPVRILFIDCDSFSLRGGSTHGGLDPLPYKAPGTTLADTATGVQFTVRSDLYKFALIAMRCIVEDLGAFEVATQHLARYVSAGDLRQLGTLLEGLGNFSDSSLETMGNGWRACISPDGRLRGRVSEGPNEAGGFVAPTVAREPARGGLRTWRVVFVVSVLLLIACAAVVVAYRS